MRNIKIVFSFLALASLFAFTTFEEVGIASYYADKFQGRSTASGEAFDQNKMTCAHKTLPFGTMLKVTGIENNKSVTVRVNDRGPFAPGRVVDLSRVAAEQIGLIKMGLMKVKIEEVSNTPAPEPVKPQPTQPTASKPEKKKGSNFGTSIDLIDIKKPAPRPKTQPKKELVEPFRCFPPREELEKAHAKWVPAKATQRAQASTLSYGIQVGAYREYTFMQTSAQQFEQQFSETVIRASQSTSSGIIYKVLLGTYSDRSAAEKYIESLNLMNINAFVVDLSTLDIMK